VLGLGLGFGKGEGTLDEELFGFFCCGRSGRGSSGLAEWLVASPNPKSFPIRGRTLNQLVRSKVVDRVLLGPYQDRSYIAVGKVSGRFISNARSVWEIL
jgi:hypothetical protein